MAWKPRREFIPELIGMGRRLTARPIWLAIVAKSEAESWLHSSQIRNEGGPAVRNQGRSVSVSSGAEAQEIVITRHGKPAGVLIGFGSEEDWFEYRLEHDPRFLRRIE
ncbi:MAG: hypothetical protein ACXU9C_07800 [Xanthobacteraceae bacterium]